MNMYMNKVDIIEIIKNQPFEKIWIYKPKRKKAIKAIVFNVEYNALKFPDSFHIPDIEIRQNIPVGMMAKIIVDWEKDYLMSERFWVEVTNISTDRNGERCYFGVMRNDTFVARYDTPIGPFYPRNICDIGVDDFLKNHNLQLAA